jgi:hypothetical protein
MKYLLLLHSADDGPPEDRTSPEYATMYAEYGAALGAMTQAGVLLECAPLRPWSSATTVRVRDGETIEAKAAKRAFIARRLAELGDNR